MSNIGLLVVVFLKMFIYIFYYIKNVHHTVNTKSKFVKFCMVWYHFLIKRVKKYKHIYKKEKEANWKRCIAEYYQWLYLRTSYVNIENMEKFSFLIFPYTYFLNFLYYFYNERSTLFFIIKTNIWVTGTILGALQVFSCFHSHMNFLKWALLWSPLYKWEEWGREQFPGPHSCVSGLCLEPLQCLEQLVFHLCLLSLSYHRKTTTLIFCFFFFFKFFDLEPALT